MTQRIPFVRLALALAITAGAHLVTGPGALAEAKPDDAQIAKILMTANAGEIDEARYVLENSDNAQVKDFARHMMSEHQKSNKEALRLTTRNKLRPKDSPTSEKLKQEVDATLAGLKSRKGPEMDRAYVDAQVSTHQTVLNELDNNLIPNARNPDLGNLLRKSRGHVATHLEHAKQLQSKLASGNPAG